MDDSQTIRVATERALSKRGFEVVTTDNPILLPFLIRTEGPDLVLLDVEMPAVEGDKAVQILGVGGDRTGPLIYLYSDKARDELERRAEECEADGFIQKGLGFDDLAALIRSALRERR